jgi:hypothetical protein
MFCLEGVEYRGPTGVLSRSYNSHMRPLELSMAHSITFKMLREIPIPTRTSDSNFGL